MSACISREGEYSDHEAVEGFTCSRCFAFDEDAALARITELEAERPPCDGGCDYNSGPEETCSAHGRPVAEVWEIASKLGAERDKLAAVVERYEFYERLRTEGVPDGHNPYHN